MRGQGGGAPRKSPFAAAGTVGRPSQYGDPVAAPPLDHDRRAGFLPKAIKEAAVLSRRAKFGWRHLSSGSLAFQSGSEQRTFAIGKKLGEGGYSTIWRVHEWQPDGSERQFAVKRVILDRRDSEQLALVEHEISVMRSLPPHPNVVELIGTCKRKRGSAGEQDEVFLLLELCRGGSFAELLIARGEANTPLAPSEAAAAFHDMALGVAHMHQQSSPIAHRDVKPENFILNDSDGRWRLCDFGSATTRTFRYRADGSTTQYEVAEEENRVHRYSTPQYRAPEMNDLRRGEPVGVAVDVWALGVALYKALFLQDLFGTPGEERLGVLNFDPSKKLAPHALPRAAPHSAGASAVLLDLLRLCLTPSPAQRPTATDVLQWLHARSDQVGGGGGIKAAWPFSRPPGAHVAGRLTIRGLEARNVFPKAASRGGVKPYVLLTCGGTRRVTSIAPKAHTASWGAEALEASTHAMQHVELTVWAHHRRTTHDFLGVVTLSLPTLVPEPTRPARVEGRVVRFSGARTSRTCRASSLLALVGAFATSPADGDGARRRRQRRCGSRVHGGGRRGAVARGPGRPTSSAPHLPPSRRTARRHPPAGARVASGRVLSLTSLHLLSRPRLLLRTACRRWPRPIAPAVVAAAAAAGTPAVIRAASGRVARRRTPHGPPRRRSQTRPPSFLSRRPPLVARHLFSRRPRSSLMQWMRPLRRGTPLALARTAAPRGEATLGRSGRPSTRRRHRRRGRHSRTPCEAEARPAISSTWAMRVRIVRVVPPTSPAWSLAADCLERSRRLAVNWRGLGRSPLTLAEPRCNPNIAGEAQT